MNKWEGVVRLNKNILEEPNHDKYDEAIIYLEGLQEPKKTLDDIASSWEGGKNKDTKIEASSDH